MTTNEHICGMKQMGWEPFNGRLWQRYYEHIIRNTAEYQRIFLYIKGNTQAWKDDWEAGQSPPCGFSDPTIR